MADSRSFLSELARFAVYGLLGVAIALMIVRWNGYRVSFREIDARRTSPEAPVSFAEEGAEPRLVHDFPADALPRNVVLLVADGLGLSQIMAARAELVGLNRRLEVERMPITGWLATHARTSLGTDSAAGGTALASGEKVKPGRLSLGPDDVVLRTLAEAARDAGLGVGVVTDSYLWDATSGSFLTHVAKRGEYAEVGRQMAASGVGFLAGTLPRRFPLEDGYDEAAALADLEAGGFTAFRSWEALVDDPAALPAAEASLALLADYGTISVVDGATILPDIASLALDRLATDPEGFFLVIETEETDTASHHHDFRRMVAGVATFDATIARVLELARRDRQTLVLVTADHETGGLSLHNASPGGELEVSWSSSGHTGLPVPIFAYGPGAQHFTGALDNTEPAKRVAEMMGWRIGAGIDGAGGFSPTPAASGVPGEDGEGGPDEEEGDES